MPELTFGAAVKELTSSEVNQFNVSVNTTARSKFGFRQWQGIRQIREVYGYDSVEVLYAKAKRRFHDGMLSHSNCILKFLEGLQREAEEQERSLVP